MDYLEGFLIGSVWSDSDYKSRRHPALHLSLAVLMLSLFALLAFKPSLQDKLIFISYPASLVILFVLILLTPLLSSYYYRLFPPVRPLLLLLYSFKYLLLLFVIMHFLLPLIPDLNEFEYLTNAILSRMDNHIVATIDFFGFAGSLFGMILGIVAGGLWIVGEMLIIAVALIAIPLVAVNILRLIQYILDVAYQKYIFLPITTEGRRSGKYQQATDRKASLDRVTVDSSDTNVMEKREEIITETDTDSVKDSVKHE